MTLILFAVFCIASYKSAIYIKQRKYLQSEQALIEKKLIEDFNKSLGQTLSCLGYISSRDIEFYGNYKKVYSSIKGNKRLHKIEFYRNFMLNYEYFYKIIDKNREAYIKLELKKHEQLLDNIDGKSLDLQQRRAVIIDDTNNLVLAGAGSGKTLTIAAKTLYLVKVKKVHPKEILLISFTKKSSEEMAHRIKDKLNIPIAVHTFHKLGLELITKKYGRRPEIQSNLAKVIDDYLENEVYSSNKNLNMIMDFFAYYLQIPKEVEEFDSLADYHEYKMNLDYETLGSKARISYLKHNQNEMRSEKQTYNKEVVKSFEELIIANHLFLNGVKYEYERLYPYKSKKPYKPDFYLPEYDIYLEHFGVNENNETPQYNDIESKKYLEDMEWKREFHKANQTKLIETYSYMNKNGNLINHLDRILKDHGISYKPVDKKLVFEAVFNYGDNRYLMDFKKLISTFITLYKSKGYTSKDFKVIDQLADKEEKNFMRIRSKLFFRIVKPIYDHYQSSLRNNGCIDFNDMINVATDIVSDGELKLNYKYIIIDEYQDISRSRYKLIQAIKINTGAKLLCVGDDWQSIYRFAGSDISLFTDFENCFGKYTLSRVEKTYRNSKELIDVASNFVLKNPMQIKKSLKSDKSLEHPVEIVGHSGDKVRALKYVIEKIVEKHGDDSDILIIGRNNADISFLSQSHEFSYENNRIIYKKYNRLIIEYMSAHRSKGLEASNVIIINGENNKLGFPNKISDDPVLSYVLTKLEPFSYAEERRLFYVALTRTKNKSYVLTTHLNESIFVKELMNKQNIRMNKTLVDNTVQQVLCPKCMVGTLIERQSRTNSFVGCSNYPNCDYTVPHISILREPKRCGCGGFMIKRSGKFGEFYGCSNWPVCEQREKA